MICQGNDHKTPLWHSSLCAALLLLPRWCRGTWGLQSATGMHSAPSHGPSHLQPNHPNHTLPGGLSRGKSSQSPAEEDVGTVQLPTSHCTVASQKSSWRNPTARHKQVTAHKAFKEDFPTQHFAEEFRQVSFHPNSICLAPGWPGASTGCRRTATAALSKKIAI